MAHTYLCFGHRCGKLSSFISVSGQGQEEGAADRPVQDAIWSRRATSVLKSAARVVCTCVGSFFLPRYMTDTFNVWMALDKVVCIVALFLSCKKVWVRGSGDWDGEL